MKIILNCAMIIIGTLIGAGFASGQEIASFFNRFSDNGLYGIIISVSLLGMITFLMMNIINKYNIQNYKSLINNNKFLFAIIKIFTFICFCIMISAIGSYGKEQYNVSFWFGAIIASIFCFISFLFKFTGLEKINNFLVPLILIGILMLGIFPKNINNIELSAMQIKEYNFTNNWLFSSIIYAGYNSILLMPILLELKTYNMKNKDIILLSIFVVIALGIAGVLIYSTVESYYPEILASELPVLTIIKECNTFIWYYYSAVILFAIFTTAFSCGYSFLKMNDDKNYFRNNCLICGLGVLFAGIGFSDLINMFFPIFGVLGILQIIIILLLHRKEKIVE